MKVSVEWLQDFIKISPPVERIAERLTLAGLEIKKIQPVEQSKDLLFETEVTTNRPDWLSHFGVAREIAAIENLSLKIPECEDAKGRQPAAGWKIDLKDTEGCPYYSGVLIEGITVPQTPDFMKQRLEACGIRSHNLIVDVTNYVLLETGQPLHAFDADLIKGQEIKIRKAKNSEKMTAIDGRELILNADDLVICDKEEVAALAGVMGARNTEVNSATRNIFLESAFFDPSRVRRASRRHALSSDSSYRFERRVDPEGVDFGRERAVWLLKKYGGKPRVSHVLKAGQQPPFNKTTIQLNTAAVEKILGISLKQHEISSILTRLKLNVAPSSGSSCRVSIPSFRADLTRPVDLVEEIARVYGYDKIPETLPAREPLLTSRSPIQKLEEAARDFFSSAGLYEAVTFSLISEKGLEHSGALRDGVKVVNPQHKELCWMRPFVFLSHLDVIKRNHHWGNSDTFFFEIANTYRKSSKGKSSVEEKVVSAVFSGKWRQKTWLDPEREVSYFDAKGVAEGFLSRLGVGTGSWESYESPNLQKGVCEVLKIGREKIGFVGQVDSKTIEAWGLDFPVYALEISLTALSNLAHGERAFLDMPRYPAIRRDISVLVSERVKVGEIADFLKSLKEPLLRDVEIFDLFIGGRIPAGKKNLGFRLTYQSEEKTLISSEIQEIHARIAEKIAKKFEAAFQ